MPAPTSRRSSPCLIDAAKRGVENEFTFLVPGKAAPVLVVSDRTDAQLGELLALRLVPLAALDAKDQEIVRADGDHGLLYLDAARFDLREEHVAIVAGLVPIHESAINPKPMGRLDLRETRALHERIARHYGFDVRHLVRAELDHLAAERGRSTDTFSGLDDDVVSVTRVQSID